ncbi:PREDICTED: uncharacterized protein LOC105564276 [Vollenhovia emeryi]|uniref:uncharacterized protein LOC105564276 n=1 Tax=Vollenhovia emeryi TaxID=411798 RepID=UPI0005F3AB99|nr:PREDICTED: uncharacterized protein LOC105564276 [Vollenhovia emeryi]
MCTLCRKPCEWDEPSCPPMVYCPTDFCSPYCGPVKPCKSFDFRASIMYRCECIKRNGLQDRCMMWDCMGRPECMTKLYPICGPGRAALLKLTDLGDIEIALRKFYCADQAKEAALAAYCRLACDKARQQQILSCNKSTEALCASTRPTATNCMSNIGNYLNNDEPACLDDSSYLFCTPSPCVLQSCQICPPCKLEEPPLPVMQFY